MEESASRSRDQMLLRALKIVEWWAALEEVSEHFEVHYQFSQSWVAVRGVSKVSGSGTPLATRTGLESSYLAP
jgi:hypothetical protein